MANAAPVRILFMRVASASLATANVCGLLDY